MMSRSYKRPTKAEQVRMARLKEMECVACEKVIYKQTAPTEVHHLLSGNKRRGHLFTIPLCAWHHRGIHPRWSSPSAEALYGPSFARKSKCFRAQFGTDAELLARTNELLEGRG